MWQSRCWAGLRVAQLGYAVLVLLLLLVSLRQQPDGGGQRLVEDVDGGGGVETGRTLKELFSFSWRW